MSLLPKLNNVPKYDLTIPSTNKEIKVRPFLVKEEKIMLIAVESQDPKQIATAVIDTVKSCIMTDVDIAKLVDDLTKLNNRTDGIQNEIGDNDIIFQLEKHHF